MCVRAHARWGVIACLYPSMTPSAAIALQVEVLCTNTGQHCRFYHNGWLSKTEPPYQLEVGGSLFNINDIQASQDSVSAFLA